MGSEKTQIGARIDDDTWARFKSFVERRHGRIRGVLSTEVEDALEAYMSAEYPTDRLSRIENDVATIKASLAEADGGEVVPAPSDGDAHTHTAHEPNISADGSEVSVDRDEGEPNRKAPKAEKADWLYDEMTPSGNPGVVLYPAAVEKKIRSTWGFGDRATFDLIGILYDNYNALPVRKGEADPWEVALAPTESDREAAIGDWSGDDEFEFVSSDRVKSVADFLH